MKRKVLIGVTGAILLLYVVLSAVEAPAVRPPSSVSAAVGQSEVLPPYTARGEDDRIVVYAGKTELVRTDTRVSQLPKIDRIRLRDGIKLFSDKELKQFLEDYCS